MKTSVVCSFRIVPHRAIPRAGVESSVACLPQAAPGISSTSVRPNTITVFEFRRDGNDTFALQSSDEAKEKGDPVRGRRRRAAAGHVRRRERGMFREGRVDLLREAAGSPRRVAGSPPEGSEVELLPERDRVESPLSEAAAQGSHSDGHAQTDQVSPPLREPGQVHAGQQREGEGRGSAEPRPEQGDSEPREPSGPRGGGLSEAGRDTAHHRQVRVRQVRPPDRAGVQESGHNEAQADLRGSVAVAQNRAESGEARRPARRSPRRHDIPVAPAGREVPVEVHQHQPGELRAQPDRQGLHRARQAQCRR